MGDQGLISAVRLADRGEHEQPDPLILSAEEVKGISWRHFETLLKSMYKQAPEMLQVKYLDDENDWVELSSDGELNEALKYTRDSGEILQLQVTSLDTKPDLTVPPVYIPTTDPGGDVTPQPPTHTPLVALRPATQTPLVNLNFESDGADQSQMANVLPATLLQPSIPLTPRGSSELPKLVYPHSTESLSSRDKLRVLKSWVESGGKWPGEAKPVESLCPSEPCSQAVCLGRNSIPNQDPFEVAGSGFEQEPSAQVLTPTPAHIPTSPVPSAVPTAGRQNSSEAPSTPPPNQPVATSQPALTKQQGAPPNASMIPKAQTPLSTSTKSAYTSAVVPMSKLPKKSPETGVPVPLPRNLPMLEGAQSGANAVTIEMPTEPEYYNKEEEIAASGGAAASTSASEETGEVVSRTGSHAASMARQSKPTVPAAESCEHSKAGCMVRRDPTQKQPGKMRTSKKEPPSHVSRQLKAKSPKPATTDNLGVGAKPKVVEMKSASQEQRKESSSEKTKAVDTESGEQSPVVAAKATSNVAGLQYNDFVKHMKKLRKELHNSVVKDVTKQTDKLLKKRLSRSLSQGSSDVDTGVTQGLFVHRGITCDHCDLEIVGVRYKCGNCEDFDLCQNCETTNTIHDPSHVFLKLRRPARHAGCVGKTRVPLLRENIYEHEAARERKKKEEREVKEKKRAKEERKRLKRKVSDEERVMIELAKKLEVIESVRFVSQDEDTKEEVTREEVKASSPVDAPIVFNALSLEKEEQEVVTPAVTSAPTVVESANTQPEIEEEEEEEEQLQKKGENVIEEKEQMEKKEETLVGEMEEEEDEEEPFLPVARERLHSGSSGSSIVRLALPTEEDSNHTIPLQVILPASKMASEDVCVEEKAESHHASLQMDGETTEPAVLEPETLTEVDLNPNPPPMYYSEDEAERSSFSSYAYYDSDSSEDFCVIDHPSHEGYEEIQPGTDSDEADTPSHQSMSSQTDGEDIQHDATPSSITVTPPAPSTAPTVAPPAPSTAPTVAPLAPSAAPVTAPTPEMKETSIEASAPELVDIEVQAEQPVTGEEVSFHGGSLTFDVDHPMSDEEKARFQKLLKAEILRDLEEKSKQKCEAEIRQHRETKHRLEEEMRRLGEEAQMVEEEKAVKTSVATEMSVASVATGTSVATTSAPVLAKDPARKTKKSIKIMRKTSKRKRAVDDNSEYKDILEVKELQAALENRRLEEAALESEARRLMEEEGEDWKRHRLNDINYYRLLVTDRRVGQMLDLEVQKFAALDSGDAAALQVIQDRLCQLDRQEKLDEKRLQLAQTDMGTVQATTSSGPASSTSEDCSSGQEMSRQTSVHSDTATAPLAQSPSRQDTESVRPQLKKASSLTESEAESYTSCGETRDANCQTNPEPASPASHLIQNVASGMSKAASTAISTAKDVFYSLQAKQNEWKVSGPSACKAQTPDWKPPISTYVPPSDTWMPPPDTYLPPKSNYLPPQNTYVPPKDTYVPPADTYTPPADTYTPPADTYTPPADTYVPPQTICSLAGNPVDGNMSTEKDTATPSSPTDQKPKQQDSQQTESATITPTPSTPTGEHRDSAGRKSSTSNLQTSPFTSLEIADSALRREVQGMWRLIEMGFANREQNRQLLVKFDGDLEKVVQALLQEEGEDHWAFHRH